MSAIVMFGLMALVLSLVMTEVHAAISAVQMVRTAWKGQGLTLAKQAKLTWLRYTCASILFHEEWCAALDKPPAYRVTIPLAVWLGSMGMWAAGAFGLGLSVAPVLMVGSSAAVAVAFFALAYGRKFNLSRKPVEVQQRTGVWMHARRATLSTSASRSDIENYSNSFKRPLVGPSFMGTKKTPGATRGRSVSRRVGCGLEQAAALGGGQEVGLCRSHVDSSGLAPRHELGQQTAENERESEDGQHERLQCS